MSSVIKEKILANKQSADDEDIQGKTQPFISLISRHIHRYSHYSVRLALFNSQGDEGLLCQIQTRAEQKN